MIELRAIRALLCSLHLWNLTEYGILRKHNITLTLHVLRVQALWM